MQWSRILRRGFYRFRVRFLQKCGAPVESCYPYTATDGNCSQACANWQASAYKINSWISVVPYGQAPNVETIKSALVEHGPLVTAMAVYSDFFSYKTGIYKHVSGSLAGYHAILIVGYDDPGQYFIVKNSWGPGWGEAGFFKIAYSEVTGDSDFGYWTIAYAGGDNPKPSCTYTLSPTSQSFGVSGGTGTVRVTASASTCNWAATSNANWVTITSNSSGTDSGTVYFSVAPNAGASSRTGTVTIGGQTFTASQSGSSCTYANSPTSRSISANGGTGTVSVTASGSSCPWIAQSNATWITITSGSSGSGSGTVNYSVAPNTSTASGTRTPSSLTVAQRIGKITMAGQTFTVTQDGCTYSINPTSQSLTASAATGSVNVTATPGCGWTAASAASWVTITSGSSGTGNGTVNYSVAANPGTTARTGTMTIATLTFTVTQSGASCTYTLNPTSKTLTASGGTGTVSVTASAGSCPWTAVSNVIWITVTSGSSGTGGGTVSYSVAPNTGIASGTKTAAVTVSQRAGTLTIAGKTFTVTQDGCAYSINPAAQSFPSSGGAGSVSVTATPGCSWTAVSNATWVTITSGKSGIGNGVVNYSLSANTSTLPRTAMITIAGLTFTVSQTGGTAPRFAVVAPNGGEMTKSGSPFTISWQSNSTVPATYKVRSITLLKNNVNYMTIVPSYGYPSLLPSTGSLTWNVPGYLPAGNDYRIRVELHRPLLGSYTLDTADVSDGTFTISP